MLTVRRLSRPCVVASAAPQLAQNLNATGFVVPHTRQTASESGNGPDSDVAGASTTR